MANSHDEFRIPKLSSDNYHAWSIRTRAALVQKSCWEAIEPGFRDMTNEERKMNNKALAFYYLDDIAFDFKPGARRKTLTSKKVKARLLVQEKRQCRREEEKGSDDDEPKAMFTKKKGKTKYHIKKDDENEANESREETSTEVKKAVHRALRLTLLSNQRESRSWYLDSGATDHMTSEKNKLMNFKSATSIVEAANKDKMQVTGNGCAEFFLCKENGGTGITLANVLHVPDLDGNLLSIGRMDKFEIFIKEKERQYCLPT
ncbi:hypothetical protein CBL_10000 [Carabus blaptoides fortunei]